MHWILYSFLFRYVIWNKKEYKIHCIWLIIFHTPENRSKYVDSIRNLYKYVDSFRNLYKYVDSVRNLYKYVDNVRNLYKFHPLEVSHGEHIPYQYVLVIK
jgi:hypothetical protein